MANRILEHASKLQAKIDALPLAKIESLSASLALEPSEHFAYQTQQSRAHALGILSTDEAQTIYVALGESPSPSNGNWARLTSLALKVSITQLMHELLSAQLAARRG
jgi:hypothetical protein